MGLPQEDGTDGPVHPWGFLYWGFMSHLIDVGSGSRWLLLLLFQTDSRHPYSGIASSVKIWAPIAEESRPPPPEFVNKVQRHFPLLPSEDKARSKLLPGHLLTLVFLLTPSLLPSFVLLNL